MKGISGALGTISSLWGRDFILAYFTPALFFVVIVLLSLGHQGFHRIIVDTMFAKPAWFLGCVLTISWIFGILLSTVSRSIVQFFEGYGALNPFQILKPLQKYRRRHIIKKNDSYKLSVEFPGDEEKILPTRLGNTIKSFERYPWVIYGADSIACWNRISSVADEDLLETMEGLRCNTYFWINIAFASLLSIPIFYGACYFRSDIAELLGKDLSAQPVSIWYVVVVVFIAWGSLQLAARAAIEWGDSFKACFDLYLPTLAKQLGYDLPTKVEWRRYFWQNVSWLFLYERTEAYEKLQEFIAVPARVGSAAPGVAPWWANSRASAEFVNEIKALLYGDLPAEDQAAQQRDPAVAAVKDLVEELKAFGNHGGGTEARTSKPLRDTTARLVAAEAVLARAIPTTSVGAIAKLRHVVQLVGSDGSYCINHVQSLEEYVRKERSSSLSVDGDDQST